ncbi:quinone oxidoreductase family protein [Nakamurella endophytica]|uniref:Quinone oxidoreductase n=1 Tax=Nakamurella endophytica TaxID=1748367 RepID=A0A917WNX8_9ACTN|nr:quinone oxidoreductase [Nakamurella endophytica]GGM17571.1 quinone oxidoreductase [Nakamurella endophytica]
MTFAMQVSEVGGPEVLRPAEIELGDTGPGRARVAVAAAGVNFVDIYRRTGVYPAELPTVLGAEGSGVVTAVGDGVDTVRVGYRVAWCDVPGSYAAEVDAPADRLVPVPAGVDMEHAAALPLQGLTAHYLASDSYRIRPGDTVLVHAGAGGVGLLLTQIAVLRGATVLTTVSTEDKAELSRAAGAAHVLVGYQDFPRWVRELTGGRGVQAVYDGVGRDTFDGSLDALAVRGFLVLFGGASGQVPPFDPQRLSSGGSLSLTRPTLGHFVHGRDELVRRSTELFDWLGAGRLDVRIGGTYPLADAGRAHEDLAGRRTTGKLLLLP